MSELGLPSLAESQEPTCWPMSFTMHAVVHHSTAAAEQTEAACQSLKTALQFVSFLHGDVSGLDAKGAAKATDALAAMGWFWADRGTMAVSNATLLSILCAGDTILTVLPGTEIHLHH